MSAPAPRSLAEIRFYVTRAVVGAGAPFGIGEEVAEAVIRLSSKGRMDWQSLATALDALGQGQSVCQLDAPDAPASALLAGPAMAWAGEGMADTHRVDDAAFASMLADALTEKGETLPPEGGVVPEAAAWEVVQRWFRECLVPSSAESRLSGAGAGLVETD